MTRDEVTQAVVAARLARGLSWQSLADLIGKPVVWVTAALLGQHPIAHADAVVLATHLGLSDEVVPILGAVPMRGVRERLREFGVDLVVESSRPSRPASGVEADVDAIVTLSRAEATARYAVVAKESMTLSSLAHGPSTALPYPLLVIGDRITQRSAAAFRSAGIQFVDASGNAFIAFDSVLVEVRGRTEPITQVPETGRQVALPQHSANISAANPLKESTSHVQLP